MQLHELKIERNKGKKRIGRGGKRGTTSGRGQKGQKSRAGHSIRPAYQDLILKIPKKRGFRNKPTSPRPLVLSISELSRRAKLLKKQGPVEISMETLAQLKLIPQSYKGKVKILGGETDLAMNLKGMNISEGAKKILIKAGGKIKE